MRKLLLFLLVALLLVACGSSDYEKQKQVAENKVANPVITEVNTNIEGCKVSYVDRGSDYRSFYIAKCQGNSTTLTQSYLQHYGKGNATARRKTTIELSAEIDTLTKEKEESQKVERALSKLSEDDKKILGLSVIEK